MAAAASRRDPDVLTFAAIILDVAARDTFCRDHGLLPPEPATLPPRTSGAGGQNISQEVWGICGEMRFNPSKPECTGRVVTRMRKHPKGPRPTFRCGVCRKELSQENGAGVIGHPEAKPTFFAFRDECNRPNVKLSRAEILWVMYCMTQGMTGAMTARLAHGHFQLRTKALVQWRSFIREVAAEELKLRPRMGGPGEVVQVDETLYRGRRRANKGRQMTGDNVDRRGVEGPWVVGLICMSTREARMFKVKKRDMSTLGRLIRQNVLPGTTVWTDRWMAYNCVPQLQDAGQPMGLIHQAVNHEENFVDPLTGANTQMIEQQWRQMKGFMHNGRCPKSSLPSWLRWFAWTSLNGPTRCKDPFLRLVDAVARQYPQA